jgi:CubicO group peptidase (beta-lactamase class C family)
MKKLLLLLILPIQLLAQPGLESISSTIKQVENSLNPSLIFGDSLPNASLEQRMKETNIKGLSIAVIRNYKIEWAKGYGWADMAENRMVNTETRFQAASISKSLNSMGILKLAEQGRLKLDADINDYLKSWKFPYDSLSKNKEISTLNLLSHTAALGVHGFPGYNRKDSLPNLIQVLNGSRPANTGAVRSYGEPGKGHKYSGGGTTISQLLLMDITGKNYADWMWKNVLKPLGMKNSSYQQPPSDTANLATGYYGSGEAVQGKYHVYPEQAAAGLWTTPSDLARYIIDCQLTLSGKKGKVLSFESMRHRMAPYIDKTAALGVFVVKKAE